MMTREAQAAKLDEIHQKLTEAVDQLVSSADWVRALTFAAKFRSRSFGNTLLIWAQHQANFLAGRVTTPAPSFVAGYRQWQQLGRQVERGQPGYMIYAPVTGRFASATPSDESSWRRLSASEQPKPGEVVRSRMVGVRPAYVWDISQTTGDPIPTPPTPQLLEGEAPAGLWDGLAAQVEAAGFVILRVPHENAIGGADGRTNYAEREVAVRTNFAEANQVTTLAHELAHILLHDPADEDASHHRGIREVEAESVALMVCAAHGMDTGTNSIPYVAGWASSVSDADPAEIVRATGERVRRTAVAVLTQLDTQQIGDGTPAGLTGEVPSLQGRASLSLDEPSHAPTNGPRVAALRL
jgi:antirestriction protein ArdC